MRTARPFEAPIFAAPARRQPAQLLEQRSAALAEEFEAARRDGHRAARAEVEALTAELAATRSRLDATVAALRNAVTDLAGRDAATLRDLERQAVTMAVELAEAVLGHELGSVPDAAMRAVERAAALLPDRGPVEVRVHPSAASELADRVHDVLGAGREFALVPDPTVEPGGCVLGVGPLRIDGQVGAAVERMRAALNP